VKWILASSCTPEKASSPISCTTMATGEFAKTKRPRGSRGRGSKRRSREKWLAKIGAAFAHQRREEHCSQCAASCADDGAAHQTVKIGAAAQGTSWQDATTEALRSKTVQEEAKRQEFAPGPNECAQSALTGAADVTAHHEDAAATMAAEVGDTVDGQWGGRDPSTPTEKGIMVLSILMTIVLWWAAGWGPVTGITMAFTVALLLWLEGWLADEGIAADIMAAVKRKSDPHVKIPRMTRQRRAAIEQKWKCVFQIMVERGMAGELAQRQLQVKQLKAQLDQLKELLVQSETKRTKERNKAQNDRAQSRRLQREHDDKLFQAGKAEGLREQEVEVLRLATENRQLRQQVQELNTKLSVFQQQLRDLKWKLQLDKRPGFFEQKAN